VRGDMPRDGITRFVRSGVRHRVPYMTRVNENCDLRLLTRRV